jgi:folate-binding protein YgfZ
VYAALLTPQGRMITDMHVFERGDAVLVTLPRPLAPAVRDRLEQFVFSEDVQVEDASETTSQIGVYGPRAETVDRDLDPGLFVARLPGGDEFGVKGFDYVTAERERLVEALAAAGAVAVTGEEVEVSRIEAGVPRFLVDMTEDTIPLEAGIEDRAISLTKGCYVGQEIIIRVLHRGGGRVARRLVRIALPAGAAVPERGAAVRPAGSGEAASRGEATIGSVTSAAESPALGRPLALGYVRREFSEPGTAVEVILKDGTSQAGEVLGR